MDVPLGRLTCIAVGLLVIIAPATVATHNSVGGHVNIVTPDEVTTGSDGGELVPDITGELRPTFHPELSQPRQAPADQSGSGYRPSDGCQPASGFTDLSTYRSALRDGTACYVGYMDGKIEYVQFTQIFAIHRSEDLTYPLNPAPGDEVCQDPLNRLDDPRCDGSTHDQNLPGYLMIDPGLLEAPMQGSAGGAGLAQAVGTDPGSGTLTFPFLLSPYLFLFGQPHPDNEAPSPHAAGSGPFGPNPAQGGGPLTDLTGACGERTRDCRLLTPTDVELYDTNDGNLQAAGVDASQARVCHYAPTSFYAHPQPERQASGPCGPTGAPMDQFLGTTTAGGLGVPGAPGTWHNTLPGWYRAVVFSDLGEVGRLVDVADEHTGSQPLADAPNPSGDLDWPPTDEDADGDLDEGAPHLWAVNPQVPLASDPLWCLRPGILATGEDATAGVPDPGVYGSYKADAIDTDLYRSAFETPYATVLDAEHPLTRPAIEQVEASVEDPVDQAVDAAPLPEDVEQALAEVPGRVTPVEEPGHDTPETPRTFTLTQDAGIACDPQGLLEAREEATELDGGLVFDATFQANTGNDDQIRSFPQPPGVLLRDPTVFDEGLPAHTEDTEAGAWWTDVHSASGVLQAVVDHDGDQRLEPCAADSGDACLWEALWDAYNPSCRDVQGTACQTLLEDRGYDVDAGVGLVTVLTVTGTTLVLDEDRTSQESLQGRTTVVGTEDPTAQNCVVGFSVGLAERADAEAIVQEACSDASGERFVIEDAFDDQTAVPNNADEQTEPGLFSLAFQWSRLVPTPRAVVDATELGQGDALCVHALLPVQEGQIAEDTRGSLELAGHNRLTTCDPLAPPAR